MASAECSSETLWKDCADWLTRCEILRSDHRANWQGATIVDLANVLRDGVLLCNLINVLNPGCIDFKDVNQRPQMAQFLCLRNIKLFLKTCKEIFCLKESDLFEPLMLFDLTNFHRVLCTLSKLSQSQKVVHQTNIRGFSLQRNGSQDEIYQSLHCIDEPIQRNTLTLDDHDEYSSYYSHITNEEIYQDLCSVQQVTAAPPIEKRDHVIKELIDTEKNYVEVLNKLKTYFMKHLSAYLTAEQLKIIFNKIPELYDVHYGLFNQLLLFNSEGKPKLSTIFLNWREHFLIYGSYCANLTDAQNLVQDLCDHNSIVNQEIDRCQTEANNGKFKLRDVLSVPMQRILKYHLLLQKLIDETPRNLDEHMALIRAREAMVDVALYINEEKRDSDHLMLLRQVQESIIDWNLPYNCLIQMYGHLIRDGELKIKSHVDQKIHTRYVFIFDKVMIMCKSIKNNQFSFKELIVLQEYEIEDVMNRAVLNTGGRWSYQWLLFKHNRDTIYTLYARSIDLKKKMIAALQEAFDNVEPSSMRNTNHKFEMTTFDKPLTCNKCSKFLKGLIYQGYLCKTCQIAVHKGCIGQSGRCERPPAYPPHPHHMDDLVRDKLWFAGEMERHEATAVLEPRCVGTYLLRVRPQGGDARYALSLKTNDSVRHMRIFKKRIEDIEQFYLSESRFFKTVLDLVRFYQYESLKENYERLDENAKLQWPYKLLIVVAECDYNTDEDSHLPLRQGCRVIVFSKDEREDWWKGIYMNRTGYFPKRFVKVVEEITRDIE